MSRTLHNRAPRRVGTNRTCCRPSPWILWGWPLCSCPSRDPWWELQTVGIIRHCFPWCHWRCISWVTQYYWVTATRSSCCRFYPSFPGRSAPESATLSATHTLASDTEPNLVAIHRHEALCHAHRDIGSGRDRLVEHLGSTFAVLSGSFFWSLCGAASVVVVPGTEPDSSSSGSVPTSQYWRLCASYLRDTDCGEINS